MNRIKCRYKNILNGKNIIIIRKKRCAVVGLSADFRLYRYVRFGYTRIQSTTTLIQSALRLPLRILRVEPCRPTPPWCACARPTPDDESRRPPAARPRLPRQTLRPSPRPPQTRYSYQRPHGGGGAWPRVGRAWRGRRTPAPQLPPPPWLPLQGHAR